MRKMSIAMVLIGMVIVAGVFWFLRSRPNSGNSTQTNQRSNQPVDVVVDYNSTKPFTAQTYTVTEGAIVNLRVNSDIADELHFHGYDLHNDLEPGQPGMITFTASQTGRFEFELESHKVTLGVIEVYPK